MILHFNDDYDVPIYINNFFKTLPDSTGDSDNPVQQNVLFTITCTLKLDAVDDGFRYLTRYFNINIDSIQVKDENTAAILTEMRNLTARIITATDDINSADSRFASFSLYIYNQATLTD